MLLMNHGHNCDKHYHLKRMHFKHTLEVSSFQKLSFDFLQQDIFVHDVKELF